MARKTLGEQYDDLLASIERTQLALENSSGQDARVKRESLEALEARRVRLEKQIEQYGAEYTVGTATNPTQPRRANIVFSS